MSFLEFNADLVKGEIYATDINHSFNIIVDSFPFALD